MLLTQLTEEEAIAYFRKVGTEHELQKIKDIFKRNSVYHLMYGSLKLLYMKVIRLNLQSIS